MIRIHGKSDGGKPVSTAGARTRFLATPHRVVQRRREDGVIVEGERCDLSQNLTQEEVSSNGQVIEANSNGKSLLLYIKDRGNFMSSQMIQEELEPIL
jgi:hypothetical protein